MKKVVCISSMLVIIQSCVGMQDNLAERYSNIAQLDERYSESFLKYCMLHIDYKIQHDEFNLIAGRVDSVFSDVNEALNIVTEEDNAFIKTYFESAYKAYKALPSDCEPCINVGNHPHGSYIPEEAFLSTFIEKIWKSQPFKK